MTPIPPTLDEMFPSPYLKASDIDGEEILTIKGFKNETFKNQKSDKDEEKTIIFFEEREKGMVFNKTNARTLKELYGNVTSEVIGKRIILYTPIVESFGKNEPALRIKPQRPPVDKKILLQHYTEIYKRGVAAKVSDIENYSISADLSESEIINLGKELKGKVEAAESF